jgi:hypothetical protein
MSIVDDLLDEQDLMDAEGRPYPDLVILTPADWGELVQLCPFIWSDIQTRERTTQLMFNGIRYALANGKLGGPRRAE